MTDTERKPRGREAKRLETRERLFEVAMEEISRHGLADADIGTIVANAGVARGTFYFHFPTKEHVVAELERREQARIADVFSAFLDHPHDLRGALDEIVRLVTDLERRLGGVVFQELLALPFSPTRPVSPDWNDNRFIVLVVGELERARAAGEIDADTDPAHSAFFVLLGLYALLTVSGTYAASDRKAMLDNFLRMARRGLEPG